MDSCTRHSLLVPKEVVNKKRSNSLFGDLKTNMRTKHIDSLSVPRKITPEEYFSSPEFQRRQKIEKEQRERAAFEKKVAFRAAQAQNPIKGKPRRKRGRNFRSR